MTKLLTAEAVNGMRECELMEAYIAAVLRGEDDSDFAVAARRSLIEEHCFDAADLDAEIDLTLETRRFNAAREEAWERSVTAGLAFDRNQKPYAGIGAGY